MSKVLLLAQGRSSSSRLPGKIFLHIGEKSILQWVHDACLDAQRILNAKKITSEVVIIGPEGDAELGAYCSKMGMKYYLPHCPENDVLTRYLMAAEKFDGSTIVRITSDCWFSNAEIIAEVASLCSQFDYVSNTIHRSFFEGLDVQACSKKALVWFDKNQPEEREHPFKIFDENKVMRDEFEKQGLSYTLYMNPKCEWTIKTSIDTADDLERARHFVARRPSTDDLVLKDNRGH